MKRGISFSDISNQGDFHCYTRYTYIHEWVLNNNTENTVLLFHKKRRQWWCFTESLRRLFFALLLTPACSTCINTDMRSSCTKALEGTRSASNTIAMESNIFDLIFTILYTTLWLDDRLLDSDRVTEWQSGRVAHCFQTTQPTQQQQPKE